MTAKKLKQTSKSGGVWLPRRVTTTLSCMSSPLDSTLARSSSPYFLSPSILCSLSRTAYLPLLVKMELISLSRCAFRPTLFVGVCSLVLFGKNRTRLRRSRRQIRLTQMGRWMGCVARSARTGTRPVVDHPGFTKESKESVFRESK